MRSTDEHCHHDRVGLSRPTAFRFSGESIDPPTTPSSYLLLAAEHTHVQFSDDGDDDDLLLLLLLDGHLLDNIQKAVAGGGWRSRDGFYVFRHH